VITPLLCYNLNISGDVKMNPTQTLSVILLLAATPMLLADEMDAAPTKNSVPTDTLMMHKKISNESKTTHHSKQSNFSIPQYIPPLRGAPANRIGGGTRGKNQQINIICFSPDHFGITSKSQPTFIFYVSKTKETSAEFTLINMANDEPLLEIPLEIFNKGIHSVDLSKFHVKLDENSEYQWFVSLIVDKNHRSQDITGSGSIKYIPNSASFTKRLAQSTPSDIAFHFAEAGLWYDALDALNKRRETENNSKLVEAQFHSFLQQIDIDVTSFP